MRVLIIIWLILTINTLGRADDVHPYSITFVHADLQDQKIRLSVRATAEDLLYFHEVKHDSAFNLTSEALSNIARQHAMTIQSAFYIRDENGYRLPSTMTQTDVTSLMEVNEVNMMMLHKFPLHYTIEFNLSAETKTLEFHQDLENYGVPAVSMFSISKNGQMLAERIEITKDKPFKMVGDALIIGTPSTENFILSYLTLTDTKISHELTLPFTLLKSFIPSTHINDQNSLSVIHDFIRQNSSVDVNGMTINPELGMVEFQSSANSQGDTLLVTIRIDYSLRMIPKDIAISWEAFTWDLRWFKSIINAFDETVDHNFSRFQPTYKTKRALKVQPKKD